MQMIYVYLLYLQQNCVNMKEVFLVQYKMLRIPPNYNVTGNDNTTPINISPKVEIISDKEEEYVGNDTPSR